MAHDAPHPEEPVQDAAALRQTVQARDAEIQMLKLLVQKLKLQLAQRNRMVFGSSSERFADGQPNPQGTLLDGGVLDEVGLPKPAMSPAANSLSIDRSLPGHLPREARVHRPGTTSDHHDITGASCGCTACGGRLREIGRDASEQLEYVPGHFKVLRHVRPKLACVRCQRVFQATAPSRPID